MSGICGVLRLDGGTPGYPEIDDILGVLGRRGPDSSRTWRANGVILGHALLATTPEAAVEVMPYHDQETGCAITADARLDNRDDLFRSLAVAADGRVVGDGELILRAYLKWGEGCTSRLLGDFAFGIWDSRNSRLFCARDQLGMRQLTYAYLPGQVFVFATEPRAVVRHSLIPDAVNEGRIADFLDELEDTDLRSTFFAYVSRLPPAHNLIVERSRVRLERYWELPDPPQLRLGCDKEYAEAFRDVFGAAVASRLRSKRPVAAMLSGGIDSGSVAAMAADILARHQLGPLRTFSVTGADPTCGPEAGSIETAVATIAGIDPRVISIEHLERDDVQSLLNLTRSDAEPFDGQMGLVRSTYLAAHQEGFNVVLDGVASDMVMNAPSHLAFLLRRGHFAQAWREARDSELFWGDLKPAWRELAIAGVGAWAPKAVRSWRREMTWKAKDRAIGRTSLCSSDLAVRANLIERRTEARKLFFGIDHLTPGARSRGLGHPSIVVGRERYDRVASALAIEPRDPFLDLRLIAFALSLPRSQLQSHGWPKLILRRAMDGLLPNSMQWRRGKEHFGWWFTRRLMGEGGLLEDLNAEQRATIGPYVNLAYLDSRPRPLSDGHCKEFVDALCLCNWLKWASNPVDAGLQNPKGIRDGASSKEVRRAEAD